MNSIRLRLLFVSLLILLAFVLITGFALQKADDASALQAQQERMRGLVYALLGAIEIDGDEAALDAFEREQIEIAYPTRTLWMNQAQAQQA